VEPDLQPATNRVKRTFAVLAEVRIDHLATVLISKSFFILSMLVCVLGFRVARVNELNCLPFLLMVSSHYALNNHALRLLVKNGRLLCVAMSLGESLKIMVV
jgi:hypothetical protein